MHLVGVSHGSKASAELVQRTIRETSPAAVILELCEERYLSVSLEAQLRPRNATIASMYDIKMSQIKLAAEKENSTTLPLFSAFTPFDQLMGALRFARAQGFVGGAFALLGLLIGSFQRATRSSGGDEFVTAMREAEALRIPILLADASQNETLSSISRVISTEALNPVLFLQGLRSLGFSALGIGAMSSNQAAAKVVPAPVARRSKWVNIPGVYLESEGLGVSLVPLLAVALFPYIVDLLPFHTSSLDVSTGEALADAAQQMQSRPSWPLFAENVGTIRAGSQVVKAISEHAEVFIDVGALIFLVRMAKVIGQERDDLMARNIQRMCRKFPGKDVVVVIGMLHCNGIARWLMSGKEPTSKVE